MLALLSGTLTMSRQGGGRVSLPYTYGSAEFQQFQCQDRSLPPVIPTQKKRIEPG